MRLTEIRHTSTHSVWPHTDGAVRVGDMYNEEFVRELPPHVDAFGYEENARTHTLTLSANVFFLHFCGDVVYVSGVYNMDALIKCIYECCLRCGILLPFSSLLMRDQPCEYTQTILYNQDFACMYNVRIRTHPPNPNVSPHPCAAGRTASSTQRSFSGDPVNIRGRPHPLLDHTPSAKGETE